MPSIKIETSANITAQDQEKLALEISSACAAWLNKPEKVIQVRIASGMTISFGGTVCKDSAFVVIALIGSIAAETKAVLPERFAAILGKYGISANRIFLRYMESEASAWGWN